MKRLKFAALIIAVLLIIGCSTAFKSLTANMPDLVLTANGVYRGYYDVASTPVKVKVDVAVQDHRVVKIDIIEHLCSPIGRKAEKITGLIIEHQSLDIDVISGATASSKGILKAVENALQSDTE